MWDIAHESMQEDAVVPFRTGLAKHGSSAGSGGTTVGYRGACGPQAGFRIAMELPLNDTRTELVDLVGTMRSRVLEPVREGCGRQRSRWEAQPAGIRKEHDCIS